MVGGGGRFGRSAFRISSLGINPVGRPLRVKIFGFISDLFHQMIIYIYDINPFGRPLGVKVAGIMKSFYQMTIIYDTYEFSCMVTRGKDTFYQL